VGKEQNHDDVLEELDAMKGCGELLRCVSILRAADVYWSADKRPVLCSILGDEEQISGAAVNSLGIVVKPHGR
jgi:hypothetical protein